MLLSNFSILNKKAAHLSRFFYASTFLLNSKFNSQTRTSRAESHFHVRTLSHLSLHTLG